MAVSEVGSSMSHERPLVIITGSSGLIGRHLQAALAADHRVVGLDVKSPNEPIDGTQWLHCDLTSEESIRAALAAIVEAHGKQVASVVHLAAYYDFSGEESDLYQELTVEGSRRLARALQPLDVEQFIFSSSLLVVDPADDTDDRLTEASPTRTEWAYPRSKLAAEQVLRAECAAIPLVILRIAGVYDDQCHSLPLSQHIRRIHERNLESYFFPGDPDHGQPFVHVDDLVRCLQSTIARRKDLSSRELFLIAEPDVVTTKELQEKIGALVHEREWPTVRVPKAVARAGAWVKQALSDEEQFIKPWMIDLADDHYAVEIQRARQRLEWEPRHRLRDRLTIMIDHLHRDPANWYRENGLPIPGSARSNGETPQR